MTVPAAASRAAVHAAQVASICAALTVRERPSFLPFTFGGLNFDVITLPGELMAAFALRYRAYTECKYISHADYPLEREFDDYDDVSVHFGCWEPAGRELVGYTRLILDRRQHLQLEHIVPIGDYRARHPGRLCEMSRLIVMPPGRPHVSKGLRYAGFRWAQMLGIEQIVGVSHTRDREAFTRRGFVPMEPYREAPYKGDHFGPLNGEPMYGNVFDVAANREHIVHLLD